MDFRGYSNFSIIDDVMLVSDKDLDGYYYNLTQRDHSKSLPHWDSLRYADFGRSTRAGIAVALDLAQKVVGKNLLIIGYDKAERYDY